MRARPVRPNIYLPVVRFGVADSDWFSILLISCVGYLAPVPLGITLLYIPLQMWTWLLATAGSIAFFNYIRIGRKPYWLQHQLKALFLNHRQYRAIPNARKHGSSRSWILDLEAGIAFSDSVSISALPTINSLLLQHNLGIQEARYERWDTHWVTTN
ncbi:hypothetical protein BH18ACI4_BH18ACI4_10090 [soil metagenome]